MNQSKFTWTYPKPPAATAAACIANNSLCKAAELYWFDVDLYDDYNILKMYYRYNSGWNCAFNRFIIALNGQLKYTLYDDGDDVDVPAFKFIPLLLLLLIELLLCPVLLLLLFDFFSLRPLPFESPLFCRELLDDDDPALFVAPAIPAKPPGNAAAKSAGCGNADRPDACSRVK